MPDSVSFRGYLGSVATRRGERNKETGIADSFVFSDRTYLSVGRAKGPRKGN